MFFQSPQAFRAGAAAIPKTATVYVDSELKNSIKARILLRSFSSRGIREFFWLQDILLAIFAALGGCQELSAKDLLGEMEEVLFAGYRNALS